MDRYCQVCLRPLRPAFQFADCVYTAPDICLCEACRLIFEPAAEVAEGGRQDLRKSDVSVEHQSVFTYNEYTRNYLWQVKENGDYAATRPLVQPFKKLITAVINNAGMNDICLVPVPEAESAVYKRGFSLIECLLAQCGFAATLLLQNAGALTELNTSEAETLLGKQAFLFAGSAAVPVILLTDLYCGGMPMAHAREVCEENHCKVLQTVSIFG